MNEKKLEKLEMPEVEVIRFEKDDVIATSGGPWGTTEQMVVEEEEEEP